jgi:hypothetical protein
MYHATMSPAIILTAPESAMERGDCLAGKAQYVSGAAATTAVLWV